MKYFSYAIMVILGSLSLLGCNNTTTSAPSPAAALSPAATPSPAASVTPISPTPSVAVTATSTTTTAQKTTPAVTNIEPEIGLIQKIQSGDLMCYITFTDEKGQKRTEGATFELCEKPQPYLNQRLRLVYGVQTVSDCRGNEPCGKSRKANVIIRLERVDVSGSNLPNDTVVLKNGEWTITIGNSNSWSGVNGTGNLTYRGCNSKQECLELSGGIVTCRNGICSTFWRNGQYSYNLTAPITDGSGSKSVSSTLIVAKDGKELQRIENLK